MKYIDFLLDKNEMWFKIVNVLLHFYKILAKTANTMNWMKIRR